MKKQLALGIAGVSAALIGGWRLVQQLADRKDETATAVGTPGMSVEPDPADAAKPTAAAAPIADSGDPAGTPSEDSSKAELYEIAQQLKIEGRSKMNKDELLKAIRQAS